MLPLHSEARAVERRTQVRLPAITPIRVATRIHQRVFEASCIDLSWGGLLFRTEEPLPSGARAIRIELPWRGQHAIRAEALILRSTALPEGGRLVAARFSRFSLRGQARFRHLLRLLQAQTAQERRQGPDDLVQELRIRVGGLPELRRILTKISTGWLTLTTLTPYELDQNLCVTITGTGRLTAHLNRLRLRARVAETKPLKDAGSERAGLHEITVLFEHTPDALRELKEGLLERLRPVLIATAPPGPIKLR